MSERSAICGVEYLGSALLIDNEGVILESVENIENAKLPLVKGVEVEHFQLGQAIETENQDGMKKSIQLIAAISESDNADSLKIIDSLTSIDVSDKSNVYLVFDKRVKVKFGDLKDLDYRIGFLKQIYFKKLSKTAKGTLDFTTAEKPNFLPE
jgi:cell division protein FtsQ